MAASLLTTQYMSPHSQYSRLAQPPPSPPMDDSRCSLPSIAKLLGLADAVSPTSEASSASMLGSPRAQAAAGSSSHQAVHEMPYAAPATASVDSRPSSSYTKLLQQRGMPPTPPMGPDASFDGGYSSPSTKPMSHLSAAVSGPGRFYETTPPLDGDVRRHQLASSSRAAAARHPVRPPFPTVGAFSTPPQMASYYQSSPLQTAASAQPHPQISNLFYQQPLPQTFPPLSVPLMLAPSSGAGPWQHHHYMNPAHGAAGFPQNQDRYVCQTCSKAFSRPSSLRIHSHSHTGEKPFKCPHAGCGKAFSVRSNMKRHERGCHGFDGGSGR